MKIKIIIITILCVILGIGAFGYFRYYYVFGEARHPDPFPFSDERLSRHPFVLAFVNLFSRSV